MFMKVTKAKVMTQQTPLVTVIMWIILNKKCAYICVSVPKYVCWVYPFSLFIDGSCYNYNYRDPSLVYKVLSSLVVHVN